jgi:hypothetical protein
MIESCGTGRWCEPGVPHSGWECVLVEELGDLTACDMCQAAQIRYGHHMQHDDFDLTLVCCCACAEHMCEEYDGKEAEGEARADAARKKSLQMIVWRTASSGNSVYCRADEFVAIVFWRFRGYSSDDTYGICVKDTKAGRQRVVTNLNNEAEARAKAISLIEEMREP